MGDVIIFGRREKSLFSPPIENYLFSTNELEVRAIFNFSSNRREDERKREYRIVSRRERGRKVKTPWWPRLLKNRGKNGQFQGG